MKILICIGVYLAMVLLLGFFLARTAKKQNGDFHEDEF